MPGKITLQDAILYCSFTLSIPFKNESTQKDAGRKKKKKKKKKKKNLVPGAHRHAFKATTQILPLLLPLFLLLLLLLLRDTPPQLFGPSPLPFRLFLLPVRGFLQAPGLRQLQRKTH